MKVSIRVSISTIFAVILIIVGVLINSIDYRITHPIILESAKNLFKSSSSNFEYKISQLINPLKERVDSGGILIANKLISPSATDNFSRFLFHMMSDHPEFSLAAWAEPNENYYSSEVRFDGTFTVARITCSSKICTAYEEHLDKNYKLLEKPKKTIWTKLDKKLLSGNSMLPYTPLTRPWYKKTLLTKKPTFSDVYLSSTFGEAKRNLAITATYPIYYKSGELLGMFTMRMKLQTLSEYVAALRIYPNSFAFVFDDNSHLLAAETLKSFSSADLPIVNNSQIPPWAFKSFYEYNKDKNKSTFFYTFNDTSYLAFFNKLSDVGNAKWFIGVAIPTSDITGPLFDRLLLITYSAIIILIVSLFVIWFVSKAISSPISELSDEANKIKSLELDDLPEDNSVILEISNLRKAFSAMRHSLKSFSRYIPCNLVRLLVANGNIAMVGGENKTLTFLFSDIAGFSGISENMNPQELMIFLSRYFEVMTKVIIENKGTVDKYIGDAIMAFWGAPLEDQLQAAHACETALSIIYKLDILNKFYKEKGSPELSIRIGINTGNAIIGNVGSEDRLNYTALGDNVNISARLEQLNKQYKTKILVSHTTYSIAKDLFNFRLIDNIIVKGRYNNIFVYELIDDGHILKNCLEEYKKDFQEAFDLYGKGQFDQAEILFNSLMLKYPEDNIASIYFERCSHFKINRPNNWNGIWIAVSK